MSLTAQFGLGTLISKTLDGHDSQYANTMAMTHSMPILWPWRTVRQYYGHDSQYANTMAM